MKKERIEYCVIDNLGSNIGTFQNDEYEEAVDFAIKEKADRILEVSYDDAEVEIGCTCVWRA